MQSTYFYTIDKFNSLRKVFETQVVKITSHDIYFVMEIWNEDVLKKSSNLKIKIGKTIYKYSSLFIYGYQLSASSIENLVFCVKFSQNRYISLKHNLTMINYCFCFQSKPPLHHQLKVSLLMLYIVLKYHYATIVYWTTQKMICFRKKRT